MIKDPHIQSLEDWDGVKVDEEQVLKYSKATCIPNRKNNGCFGDPWSPGNTASRYIARAAAPHVITHAPTPHASTTAERTQKQGRVQEKPVEGVHRRGDVDVELEEEPPPQPAK